VDPAWAKTLGAELRWLGAELGGVRDLEVMRGRLRAHARRLSTSEIAAAHRVVGRLDRDHERARADLLAALAQPRYAKLRHTLDEATRAPVCTESAALAARSTLATVVAVRWKKLRRSVKMLGDEPSDALLHDVRIRAKRCRYAAEACVIAYGTKAERFASALAAVQDALGENQDAVVAGAWLAKVALECEPGEAYAIGMLAEVERAAGREARARVPRAWAHASRRRLREWL
jgi:CHAD domain-containing protein